MRKPAFCKCENKGSDQLRDKTVQAQLISAFVFNVDSAIPLFPQSETSSL